MVMAAFCHEHGLCNGSTRIGCALQFTSRADLAGTLLNTNINRSPTSHEANPDKVNYPDNVDKMLTVLRFRDSNSSDLGLVSW